MDEGPTGRILAQFKSEKGELVGSPFDLSLDTSADKLQLVCQAFLPQVFPFRGLLLCLKIDSLIYSLLIN